MPEIRIQGDGDKESGEEGGQKGWYELDEGEQVGCNKLETGSGKEYGSFRPKYGGGEDEQTYGLPRLDGGSFGVGIGEEEGSCQCGYRDVSLDR